MDAFALLIRFLIETILLGGSLVISCAIGFALSPSHQRVRQLIFSAVIFIGLYLVSFQLVVNEHPILYSSLTLLACIILAYQLFDTTDSMLFNSFRMGLFGLVAMLMVLHGIFLFFILVAWLLA